MRGWDGELQIMQGFVEQEVTLDSFFECTGKSLEIFEPQSKRGVIYLVKSDVKNPSPAHP